MEEEVAMVQVPRRQLYVHRRALLDRTEQVHDKGIHLRVLQPANEVSTTRDDVVDGSERVMRLHLREDVAGAGDETGV